MEILHGETSEGVAGTGLPEFYDDIPMSRFLTTPRELYFRNRELHIDLNVRERIPLKLGSLVGGTGKAEVRTVDCRNLGYRRNLVCKIMKTPPKTEYTMKPLDLRRLRHVHVVAFVATFTHNHRDYALMYPHAKTDLGKYMDPVSNWLRGEEFYDSHGPLVSKVEDLDLSMSAPARISRLRNFFPCLTEALEYLHRENVKHKDIKPANILIDRFDSPILADFDISHRYTDQKDAPTRGPTRFTYPYAAPEAIGNDDRPFQSDTFSLGCVFSEMITLVMCQNLLDFEAHRASGPNRDAAFHQCIATTQDWLHRLYDPNCTSALRNANENTLQLVPIEGYHQDQALITAVKTICSMLEFTAGSRPIANGLSRSFHPIATTECSECAKQAPGDQPLPQVVPVRNTASGIAQNSNAALAPEPSRSPTYLAIPTQVLRTGERGGSFGGRMAPVNGAQSIPERQHEETHRLIDQHLTSAGQRSASAEHSPALRQQPTGLSGRTPLPPEKPSASSEQSPAPSSESNQAANGIFDYSGRLSQRQKLREAIGYDVQNRLWKIRLASEFQSEYCLPSELLQPPLTVLLQNSKGPGSR
jgi:serine/threonine protein kinase